MNLNQRKNEVPASSAKEELEELEDLIKYVRKRNLRKRGEQ